MKRLFLIEYYKLIANRSSRVLVVMYFILLTSIALVASINFKIGPINFHLADQGIFNFPYIWHFNSFIAGLLKLFLAVIIVSMMANEYSNKTLKQNLIDGLSKREFLNSKMIMVLFFASISVVFIFVVSLILGFSFSNYTELSIVFSELEFLFAYFVKLVGFFSFCLFLGVLIKRSAFALGFLGVWQFIEGILFGLLKWRFLKNSSIDAQDISQFFPLNSISNTLSEPFSRLSVVKNIASQIGENVGSDSYFDFSALLIVLFWTFVFYYLSYRLLQKRDL